MPAFAWHIFAFGVTGIFLIVITYRTLAIIRLPVHLRWELSSIPHEKGKCSYGGSYLEEYEWWKKPLRRSHISPLIYMAKEVFLLRSVWGHNKVLWPFAMSFHMGMYLIVGMLFLQVMNAVLVMAELPLSLVDSSRGIVSALALGGYLLGSLGTFGLILKRALDSNLRPFNTTLRYFNLLFLSAVFISGDYAWLRSGDFTSEVSLFTRNLITLTPNITVAFPLSLHLGISFFFLLYLPLTDMIHFIAKYFTYHEIRWDNKPQNEKMEKELGVLLGQPVTWSAAHIKADAKKNWIDITTTEVSGEK